MPILIDPFAFNPAGSFDTMHAYFMCSWMRAQYVNGAGDSTYDDVIKAVCGATGFQVFPHFTDGDYIFPRTDILTLPGERAAVMIRGTSVLPGEAIAETVYSDLVSGAPWLGRQSRYFRVVAVRRWLNIGTSLPAQWIIGGHSLGGAIAGLIGINGASKYFTAGSPREGDGTYANSRPTPLKLRLTTSGDPIPLVPFSSNSVLDQLNVDMPLFPAAQFYRHWGIRHHLWADGSLTLPPHRDRNIVLEATEFLVNAALEGIVNHYAPAYCYRLRLAIPIAFPATKPDLDFPGIVELDNLNRGLNERGNAEPWAISGRPGAGIPVSRRPPLPPEFKPGIDPDPYQFHCE